MAKEWEYAKASKWMAEHGGPQKTLEIVKDYYMEKGFKEGADSRNPLIVLVGLTALVAGVTGKCIYDKIIEKKTIEIKTESAKQTKVREAEEELMKAVRQNTRIETKELGELDENGLELLMEV